VRPEGLGQLRKFIHFIVSRTRDLPACSIVPQPLRYRGVPYFNLYVLVIAETKVSERNGADAHQIQFALKLFVGAVVVYC
jgi:hypothetical protein